VDKFPSRERATAAALEPRVSAVVVARGGPRSVALGGDPLDLCLRSALAEPWIDDLIIVDHGEAPGTSSALRALQADRRDVKVVVADRNASRAAAANLGARHARGRWLLFLDPDVVLQRGAVSRLAAAGGGAHTPWIVGGRLTDIRGRERPAARAGALNAFSAIALAIDWPQGRLSRARRGRAPPTAERVAAVSDAFMLIPRSDFDALGGFDEGYATDYADLDLCLRAAAAGGSVLFQPAASGVQLARAPHRGRRQAQGLARFAAKSARTPIEKSFAVVARPALSLLVWLRDFVVGRPPVRR
jgi:N-acetylglucosaminyl-diphospho-decaprenol L-rhamnosyltransferase